MPSRVIYCAMGCISLLANHPHDTLRKLDQGVVASVPDETMEALARKVEMPALLYFSRQTYNEASSGLSEEETEEALRRRLERWAPQALARATDWIVRRERRALTLTALAGRAAKGDRAQQLELHFTSGLELLTSLVSAGRYDDMELTELIIAVVEGDVLLMAELGKSAESKTRTTFAKTLAQELERHGSDDFAQALPFVEPQRGVWVQPFDTELKAFLKVRGEAAVPWRGGVVTTLSPRVTEDFQKKGRKVSILYQDAGELRQAFDEFTAAQMNREFEERAAAKPAARERQRADYLNLRRLELALMRRALRASAVTKAPKLVAILDGQIQTETEVLAAQLAKADSWLVPGDAADPLQRLLGLEEELEQEARFFRELGRLKGAASLARSMDDILAAKAADIARLQNL